MEGDYPCLVTPPTSFHRVLLLSIVLLFGVPLFAQREMMTFGVKGGAQLTKSFVFESERGEPDASKETNYTRPILGLTFEKPLPKAISIEVDATYNPERFRYQQHCVVRTKSGICSGTVTDWESHGYTLELPVVVKKYWGERSRERYFANSGISFRRMTLSNWRDPTFPFCLPPPTTPVPFCSYIAQNTHSSLGFVFGGGVDFRFDYFHLYPELRYTRWLGNEFTGRTDILQPNQNALTILLGFSYGR
jgi:hypothetical protein